VKLGTLAFEGPVNALPDQDIRGFAADKGADIAIVRITLSRYESVNQAVSNGVAIAYVPQNVPRFDYIVGLYKKLNKNPGTLH
jgi:DNA-binding transcriptional LysR family regulator